MFDVGFYELLVIALIALLVFGPKELATVMFKLGKLAKVVKDFQFDFKTKNQKIFDQLELEDYEANAKSRAAQKQPLIDTVDHGKK
jgi:Sec-independent protein translocase protein TatA